MLQAIGVIVALALAYTVIALAAERLPPAYGAGAAFLIPLLGLAGAVWLFSQGRKDEPPQ